MNTINQRRLDKEAVREGLLKYFRQAFDMLPEIDKPRILDIGCGSGVSTMELARLTNGEIIGLDIDQPALDIFIYKIKKAGLSHRIKAIRCSMTDMDFLDESFDIVWSEGSIYAVGFKKGLKDWKKLLKPNGYLVVHDQEGDVEQKLKQISDCGYEMLDNFILNQETWRAEYFVPLEKLINEIKTKYGKDKDAIAVLKDAETELDMFNRYPQNNSSVCFIMQKR